MDIEFHYYITHLIAARAGFRGDDLRTLAYASQYTDDNNYEYKIQKGRNWFYNNLISQTMDILKPNDDRLSIYPLFHFIPGDATAVVALRSDGMIRACNTTPDSPNANIIIDQSLQTNNFYQIGIASHAYVDTWAHQNFVGYRNRFNDFPGFVNRIIPNIGHADARHQPDWPAHVWEDSRLDHPRVENKPRFLGAAAGLFNKLRKHFDPTCSDAALAADREGLITDLDQAIGEPDSNNGQQQNRIQRYQNLAVTASFGAVAISLYHERAWYDQCVDCDIRTIPQGKSQITKRLYNFKGLYEQSDWYKFQEAVKQYAEMAETVLEVPLTFVRQDMV